jgi:hypothetical protein
LCKFWRAYEWILSEYFGRFFGHLIYFMTIWQRCGNLVMFFLLRDIVSRKIWQPCYVPQPRPNQSFLNFQNTFPEKNENWVVRSTYYRNLLFFIVHKLKNRESCRFGIFVQCLKWFTNKISLTVLTKTQKSWYFDCVSMKYLSPE